MLDRSLEFDMLGMGDRSLLGIPWLKIEGKSHNKECIRKLDVLLIKYTLCTISLMAISNSDILLVNIII